jgi:uncharacterized protein (TIGR02646 family)
MRYINIKKLKLPAGWPTRAIEALDAVRRQPPTERQNEINRRAKIWKDLRTELGDLSHQKCWYCESKDIRSTNPIDHFRPKGSVKECPGHEGYWWLAFDWTNYRFCCIYCNSLKEDEMTGIVGGKADQFPLENEAQRAVKEGDDYKAELHCLLDPTKAGDPGLLWFDQDGNAIPKHPREVHPYLYCRARISIKAYSLNHNLIVTQRMFLYTEIIGIIENGDIYFNRYVCGDNLAEHALNDVIDGLVRLTDEDSPYSAAARCYIMGQRSPDREWLDAVFIAH